MQTTTKTYRAAYVNYMVLTGPEHSHLEDEKLIEIALTELKDNGCYGDEHHQVTEQDIEIGDWTE